MTRKMKDSGIEWIGEIPEDWRVMSLKHSLKGLRTGINPRDTFQLGEGNNFYVTIKNFKDGKLFLDEKCDRITDEALEIINKRADLKVNDILFSSISDEGHIFLIKEKPKNWTINESVFSIRPNKKIIHPKFLSYILPKNYIFAELKSKETGSTFKSIKQDHLKDSKIVVPNLNEQRYIVQFLDKKTNQIDGIRNTIIKEIENLEDYKKSVITEAVTKGLDKNVEMKDSGIEWIGEIPKHWNVLRIKNAALLKARIGWQGLRSDEFLEDTGLPYLVTGTDFNNGFIDWANCVRISEKRFEMDKNIQIKENDLLITKDGTIGKLAIARNCPEKASLNSGVFVMRNQGPYKYIDKYMYYLLQSEQFYLWFELNDAGNSTIRHLYQKDFYNFSFTYPKLKEQEKIAKYLDKKCKLIDDSIAIKQKQLETLEEYKKSLIYEYVTGKKEVNDGEET